MSFLESIQVGGKWAVVWGIGMLVGGGLIPQNMANVVSATILIGIGVTIYAVTWAILRSRNSN